MQQRDTQPILIVEDSEDDFEATMRAFKRTNLRNSIRWAASDGALGWSCLRMLIAAGPIARISDWARSRVDQTSESRALAIRRIRSMTGGLGSGIGWTYCSISASC
mgnify:CR=1 FL=1